jgi:hypothetical protein
VTPLGLRRRGERGQAGGMEVLPFGLLIFIGGALLITNIWGVVDSKFATDAAAREAARWVVEAAGQATSADALRAGATQIATDTLADHGRRGPVDVQVGPAGAGFVRCERIEVTVAIQVPAIRLPFVGGFGDAFDVTATHGELIDPTRSGVDGLATCVQ